MAVPVRPLRGIAVYTYFFFGETALPFKFLILRFLDRCSAARLVRLLHS